MREEQIGSYNYRIGNLDAIRQFHLARRLAPLQLALGLSISDIGAKLQEDGAEAVLAAFMGPVIKELAVMPQDTVDYLLRECLSVCARQQPGGYAALTSASGALMFADLKMPDMVRLCLAVIQENLGDFFGLPADDKPA